MTPPICPVRRWKLLLIILLAGGTLTQMVGQGLIPLRSLSLKEGLSETTNSFMHRATDGAMYIGSMDGTSVFDGQGVTVYRESNDAASHNRYLGGSNQSPFFETQAGSIWYTTDRAIICRNHSDGFIRSYQIDTTLGNERYYAFALEQDRYLWVIMQKQLYRLDLKYPEAILGATPLIAMEFTRGIVRKDSKGRVREIWGSFWMAPGAIRLVIDEQSRVAGSIDTLTTLPDGRLLPGLQQWMVDEQNNLYVTASGGLYIFPDNALHKYVYLPFPAGVRNAMGLAWRKPGHLWLLSNTGLLAYNGTETLHRLTAAETGLPATATSGDALYIDRDIPGRREMIWLGRRNRGLLYGNLATNRIRNYLSDNAIPGERVRHIMAGKKGQLLIKQAGSWLLFDRNGFLSERIPVAQPTTTNPTSLASFFGEQLWPIIDTKEQLISSVSLAGQDRLINRLFSLPVRSQLLHSSSINGEWLPDSSVINPLKICAAGHYLAIANQLGSVQLRKLNSSADSLGSYLDLPAYTSPNYGPISDIVYDSARQLLWVTSNKGLHSINPGKFNSKSYNTKDGLVSVNLQSVLLADNGDLWLSSNRGLFNFRPERTSRPNFHLTKADGLSADEFLHGFSTKTTDGQLAFASANGVDVFHPDSLHPLALPTRPGIRSMLVHGEPWVGEKDISRTQFLDLPYNQNTLFFSLSGREFAAPDRTQFQFITEVDGELSDTIDLNTSSSLTLANLAPAAYRFGISARAKGNPAFDPPNWLAINIYPHWSQTSWFRALMMITAILTVSLIFAFRYRYQLRVEQAKAAEQRLVAEQREARLQRKIDLEDQRRRITSRMHNDIGGSLTTLSMLSSRLGRTDDLNNAQEISSKISHWARDVRRRFSSFLRVMNPQYDRIERIVGVLRTYAADVLSDNNVQVDFDLPYQFPDFSISPDFSMGLLELTQELLHNIIKYAEASRVGIQLRLEGPNIYLTISDNGTGFSPDDDDFKKGIGLSSLQALSQKFGGRLRYVQPKAGGTEANCWLRIQTQE